MARMVKPFLDEDRCAIIEPLLPQAKSTPKGGRKPIDNRRVLEGLDRGPKIGRKIWRLLCLELWQQTFHDRSAEFKALRRKEVLA